jgi:hypothetical protein
MKINFTWLKRLQINLFKKIIKREKEFELTREILTDSEAYLNEKTRIIRVFNNFPNNFPFFVEEMQQRSKMNFFLEHLLQKVSEIVSAENRRRMKFIEQHAQNIPVQVI